MTSRQRQSVLKKISARRKSNPADAPPLWVAFLRGKGGPTSAPATPRKQEILTRREMEILRLVATGDTDRGIAGSLFLSNRTVSNHVSRILGKLDAPTRRAAVLTAMQIGIL